MRLIDIEKLRGCAIIRPRNSTEIKVIESFADKIKHQDIPTAFDLDHALNQLEEELRLSEEEKQKVNSLQFDQVKGYANGIANAKLIVEGCVFPNSKDSGQGVDWPKIPMDTPILVRDGNTEQWEKRYFANYLGGTVYAWDAGMTSKDTRTVSAWDQAKLPEEAQE